jgi:hypothetical protein
MKFSDIVRGTRQDEELELPRIIGQAEDAPAPKCRVRALNGVEEELALAAAAKRAKAQGADAKVGDPIYDLALMYETIVLACVDPDSPSHARTPVFDGGADQARELYGRDAVTLVYSQQQFYQDRVAPQLGRLTPIDYTAGALVLGGEDENAALRFFLRCRPGLQWSFVRTLAVLQVNSLGRSLSSGSSSATAMPSESGAPSSN